MNLASFIAATEAEGPGKRAALWTQGCRLACPGCCNPDMQPFTARSVVDVADVFSLVKKSADENNIEGITLLGGEPVLQAEGLAALAEMCRESNLSVMLFTGFLYDELLAMQNEAVNRLLTCTDILVDGPYIEEQRDTERAWVGSKNQKFYYLSERYQSGLEYKSQFRSVEYRISEKDIIVNGWPFL